MKLLLSCTAALFLAPLTPQGHPSQSPPEAGGRGTDAFVLHSAGFAAWLADAKDAGLARALDLVDERLIELGQDLRQGGAPPELVQLVCDVVRSPWCLRFGVQDPESATGVRAQLTVRCTDAAGARALVQRIEGLCSSAGIPLTSDDSDPALRVTLTPLGPIRFGPAQDGGASVRIALSEPVPESFIFESALPGGTAPLFYTRYDGARLGALLESKLGTEEPAWKVLEALGLVGECAPVRTWAVGAVDGRMLSVARVANWKHSAEELGLSAFEPLTPEDFRRIPEDASIAHLAQVRPAGLLTLLHRIQPGARQQVHGMVQSMIGVDIDADLFDLLGPTFGAYMTRTAGGGGLLSSVAFIESGAAPRAAQSLARLAQFALTAAAPKTDGRVALRAWKHGGVDCSSLVFPGLPVPLEVSCAASADALWIAASRSALQAALDQAQGERSLLDRGLPPDATQESVSFGFFDTAHFLERGYGSASLLAAGLANAVRSPRDAAREPGQVLPPFPALAQGVQPAVSWSRIEGTDLVTRASFERSFVAHGTALAGTPLASSYTGLVGLGMVSSIAIPKLMSARNSANEAAAIATLRSIASAQAQFQAVGLVDTDGDGVGEHGYFGELAGARPVRVGRQGRSAWDPTGETMDPPVLSPAFAALADDGTGAVCVQRSGYVFQMWLPANTTDGGPEGCAEPADWPPREAARVDPELAERFWCCYAWPVNPGSTGSRVFFIDQEGDLLVCDSPGEYGGLFAQGGVQPAFNAAFHAGGGVAVDGLVWRPFE